MRSVVGKIARVAVILALLATACRAEVNFAVNVLEDGSGDFTVEAGVDEELAAVLPGDIDPLEILGGQLDLTAFEATELEPFDRDGLMFRAFRGQFTDLDALSRDFIENPSTPFEAITVANTDEGLSIEIIVELPDLAGAAEALGLPVDGSVLTDSEALASHVRMTLPGEVVMHDADRTLPNGDLEWDLPLTGGTKTLTAQTEFNDTSLAWIPIAIAALAIAGVAGVALLAGRSRRRRELAAVAAAQEAQPWTPPQPIVEEPDVSQ